MTSRLRPKRCILVASVFAPMFTMALFDAALAQQATPTNLVAPADLALRTITPLGEAGVVIPKGTALTNFEIQGGQVTIRQGPFSAVVDLAVLQPAPPAEVPTPTAEPVAATPEPTAEPPATPVPTPVDVADMPGIDLSALPPWALPAACGALGLYALFSTIAWWRARRAAAVAPTETGSTSPTPVIVIPKNAPAKPAVMSDGGRAIACPLCGAAIALAKLSAGRQTCPTCRQVFVCE